MPTAAVGDHSIIQSQQSTTARQKVSGIFKQMKSDLVRIQNPSQQVVTTPQCAEDFRRWKWRVQKDAHLGHGNSPSQVGGQNEQMETMDPNQVSFIETLHYHFGEFAIDSIVSGPEFLFSSSATMNRSLLDIIHGVFRELMVGGWTLSHAGLLS
jgi:hypothetical protein